MQASFIAFKRSPTDILLVCSRDILAATLKRLSMFVLRAKARLTDASHEFGLAGLAGIALESIAGKDHSTMEKIDFNDGNLIWLPPAGTEPRALWIAPAGVPFPPGPAMAQERWLWGDVASGVATVTAPIVDAFVPQMLNYESVGGVNFKKGCYPGQEVIARSQFRGILKRRAYRVHGEAPMHVGQEIFTTTDPEQPCGLVAQSAPTPGGGHDAIVSIQVSAAESGDLHLGSALGPGVRLLPLPYPLLADI